MTLPEHPRVAKRARVRFDDSRDSHVLLMPERVVMLSPSAAEILKLCDGVRTVPDIVAELHTRYAATDLEDDVKEFLEEAVTRQWLERPGPS